MKIICRPSGSGKTSELIKQCAKKGGYIVCFNIEEADRVYEISNSMNVTIPFPITFEEFIRGQFFSSGVKMVYIDNIDLCLQTISKVPIDTITVTNNRERL